MDGFCRTGKCDTRTAGSVLPVRIKSEFLLNNVCVPQSVHPTRITFTFATYESMNQCLSRMNEAPVEQNPCDDMSLIAPGHYNIFQYWAWLEETRVFRLSECFEMEKSLFFPCVAVFLIRRREG